MGSIIKKCYKLVHGVSHFYLLEKKTTEKCETQEDIYCISTLMAQKKHFSRIKLNKI